MVSDDAAYAVPWMRSLALRTDLAIARLGGSEVEDRGTHALLRSPHNPDYWWGNALVLRDLPVPGGEREVIGAFGTEFPDADHVAIAIDGLGAREPTLLAPFVEAGLQVSVDAVLIADAVPIAERWAAPLATPEGHPKTDLRPLDTDEDWAHWATLELAVADDPEKAPQRYHQRRADAEQDICQRGDGVRMGLFVDGALVCTAGCFRTDQQTGRFQSVTTHPDHRRQGYAARVVQAAGITVQQSLGVRRLVIVADPDGPAIGIYRRLGFTDSELATTMAVSRSALGSRG